MAKKQPVKELINELDAIIEQAETPQIIMPAVCTHCKSINTKIRSSNTMPKTPLYVPELAKTFEGRKINYCICNDCGRSFVTNEPVGASC